MHMRPNMAISNQTQRDSGEPRRQTELFRLKKGSNRAVCEVWSHSRGWELRLEVSSELLLRTQICETEEEVYNASTRWRQAMHEKGWSDLA